MLTGQAHTVAFTALPLKAAVRKTENIIDGKPVKVRVCHADALITLNHFSGKSHHAAPYAATTPRRFAGRCSQEWL